MAQTRRRHEQPRFVAGLALLTIAVAVVIEFGIFLLPTNYRHSLGIRLITVWPLALIVALLAGRASSRLFRSIEENEAARTEALGIVAYLKARNAILHIVASSIDITAAFQKLSERIADIVPCDRVGLALLTDDGQEFRTLTSRVRPEEKRSKGRPEVQLPRAGTLVGHVVTSREPAIENHIGPLASKYFDANLLHTAGFRSALVLPVIYEDRSLGTLSCVSRSSNAFDKSHVEALVPVAELLGVAYTNQKLAKALARTESAQAIADGIFSVVYEMTDAVQALVGLADVV